MIKRARPPSASDDISGDASMVPIIARVRGEEGSESDDFRGRDRSHATANMQRKANTLNR